MLPNSHPRTAARKHGRGVLAMCAKELIQLTPAECQGGLVPAESLQVLYTDFPSSLHEKKKNTPTTAAHASGNCLPWVRRHPILKPVRTKLRARLTAKQT